jgi:hypothetical protein
MSGLRTPVLLVVHRRPDLTRRVFEAIARAQPARLFIAADGPAAAADREACELTRAAVEHVDWHCEVLRDFSDENLGLDRRMISALNWVFAAEDSVIVLEDDCLPDRRFFEFCSSLLDHYRDDPRVMHISGECYRTRRESDRSYFFSKYPLAWGWATWRRAWARFDPRTSGWPQFEKLAEAQGLFDTADERAYWLSTFARFYDDAAAGRPASWDYAWYFACMTSGLSIHPAANLVSNIGYGPMASHTREPSTLAARPIEPLEERLCHPDSVVRDRQADIDTFDRRFPGALLKHQRSVRHQLGRPARWALRMMRRGLASRRVDL